jgi:tetratricopeptide (TPR) repeat protein
VKPRPRPRRVRRWLALFVALVAVAVVAGWVIWETLVRPARAARLPGLPDVSGAPAALADAIRSMDGAARRRPTSPQVVGALCTAYHANDFLEQAAQCYDLVERLEAGDWRWPYYQALLLFDRGRVEGAAERLRRAVALNGRYAPAWFRLGEEEFKRGRDAEARAAYQRALAAAIGGGASSSASLSAYAGWGLARIAQRQGDIAGARVLLEKAVADAPQFGPAHRTLAEVLAVEGRRADAQREQLLSRRLPPYVPPPDPIAESLLASSRNSAVLLKAASVADRAGDRVRRETLTRRALEVDDGNAQVVYRMGVVLQELGRPEEALVFFERHRRMAPAELGTLNRIGQCLIELGRLNDAEAAFRERLARQDDGAAHYNLALALHRGGRFDEAIPHYLRAIEKTPNDAAPLNNLAVGFASRGEVRPAIEHYRRAIAIQPDSADAHANLGALLAQHGMLEEALREFRDAVSLDPLHANAQFHLGATLALQGQADLAIEALEQAIASDPRHVEARTSLGGLLARRGRVGDARRHFEAALAVNPNHADAHYNLALTFMGDGAPTDLALAHLRRALELDPSHLPARQLLAR